MKAIVTGVSGQDGYYMVQHLLARDFEILGLTSDLAKAQPNFTGCQKRLLLHQFDYAKIGEVGPIVNTFSPNLIFNLAAKATGKGMFDAPHEISRVNGGFVIDILEALRRSPRRDEIVLCQASSSEMYGDVDETPQSETTAFRPKSPYGAAKLFAHNMVKIYRSSYGLRCCSAILYNHESVRRSTDFVTKKIASGAAAIKLGLSSSLVLGSLEARRDWGYAPEYVEAMFQMACADSIDDYVVATGRLQTVRDLCQVAFSHLNLDYRDYVVVNSDDRRIAKSVNLQGDPTRIKARLGWSAKKNVQEIMVELVDHEVARLSHGKQ